MLVLKELSGKLIIAPAEKYHSGAYVCVASNTGGVRESRAARLSVLGETTLPQLPLTTAYVITALTISALNVTPCSECKHNYTQVPQFSTVQLISEFLFSSTAAKPVLVLKPENVSVRAGESAQFYCRAKGDPPPAVVWSREQGPLPNGRYFITARHRNTHSVHRVNFFSFSSFTFKYKKKDLTSDFSGLTVCTD